MKKQPRRKRPDPKLEVKVESLRLLVADQVAGVVGGHLTGCTFTTGTDKK